MAGSLRALIKNPGSLDTADGWQVEIAGEGRSFAAWEAIFSGVLATDLAATIGLAKL